MNQVEFTQEMEGNVISTASPRHTMYIVKNTTLNANQDNLKQWIGEQNPYDVIFATVGTSTMIKIVHNVPM